MRYTANRRTCTAVLVLLFAFLIISVIPKLPGVAGSAYSPPQPVDQFCNASSITINSVGTATPYPSPLSVSGLSGTVSNLTVTLNSFSHAFPDDVDILLVAPGGQNAIIMSDVGGSSPASGVTLTLDDAAATSLPDAGPLVSGTFKPTNVNALDTFPPPAPAPSGGSALSAFNGISPNGTWNLYIVDDAGGDAGSISGGWCLDITTVGATPCVLTCPPDMSQGPDSGQCGAQVSYPSPTSTGTCGTITCSPASGSFFPMGITTVNCAGAGGGSCSFTVTITGTCPSGCNPTSITINSGGAASPYPSPLTISGNTGIISSVTVTLTNLSHAFPDDVDILLVGPGGQNAIILSDVGGSAPTSSVTLTLDDAAATSLPDSGPLVSGTFKPTNSGPVDTFPAPAPAPSGGSALSVFNGTDPNGVWRLYVADDSPGDGGSIAGGWCLNITTVPVTCLLTCPSDVTQPNTSGQCGAFVSYAEPTTIGVCGPPSCSPASGSFFPIGTTTVNCTAGGGGACSFTVTVTGTCPGGCNPTAITINASGAASPYPSTLAISGVSGTVASLTVTLNNLSHTNPDDVDILLVGPGGQNAIIMSDVGGSIAASNVTLTLTDATASSLPDAGPLVSGTFKPTNVGAGDTFPAPAPAPSGGSALSVFTGTDPNGTWKLYIIDDVGGDAGSISGGWCLDITATPPPCSITCPSNVTQSNDPGQCGAIVNYPPPTTTGSCGTVTCAPASGSFFPVGTTTVTCTASDGNMSSCSFTVTVNDTEAPQITLTSGTIELWPPNHNYQTITMSQLVASATDNCDGNVFNNVVITSVSSDEAENAPGNDDGNTVNDIVIAANCKSVQLRAERDANLNGRVYTINLKVTDSAGNMSTASRTVVVPVNQSGGGAILGPGPGYSVTCP
jgi:subtilisin-like proprotein convertase family protein